MRSRSRCVWPSSVASTHSGTGGGAAPPMPGLVCGSRTLGDVTSVWPSPLGGVVLIVIEPARDTMNV